MEVEVSDACADPVTDACADQDRVAIALLGLPDDVPLDPPATEAACRARVELAAALTTARQLDEIGRPRPFPPDLPDKYREPMVTEVARKVVLTCPELGLDLRRVDCSEFPCLAFFVGSEQVNPTRCSTWVDVYGGGVTNSSGVLVGADGERLHYNLVGPGIPQDLVPPEPQPEPEDGMFVQSNGMKRLRARGQEAREEVMAAYGARELTEAEKREDSRDFWGRLADEGDEGAQKMLEMLEKQWADEDARGEGEPPP
jgi:hypothetical protein